MCWEIVAPLCRHRCQRSTTLLWPQLLSKWQTAWQSQVVEIYHGDPSNKWHRAPPGRLGRQTSDKQLFVLFHVLPSSPLLFSPLHVHFCYWAAQSVCTLIVFSIQIGCLCWVPLIKLSFNQVSRCKTVTLLLFDSWLWLLSLGVIYQDLRVWQVEKLACFCFMDLHNGPLECHLIFSHTWNRRNNSRKPC